MKQYQPRPHNVEAMEVDGVNVATSVNHETITVTVTRRVELGEYVFSFRPPKNERDYWSDFQELIEGVDPAERHYLCVDEDGKATYLRAADFERIYQEF